MIYGSDDVQRFFYAVTAEDDAVQQHLLVVFGRNQDMNPITDGNEIGTHTGLRANLRLIAAQAADAIRHPDINPSTWMDIGDGTKYLC
jgi:hypothetical protein